MVKLCAAKIKLASPFSAHIRPFLFFRSSLKQSNATVVTYLLDTPVMALEAFSPGSPCLESLGFYLVKLSPQQFFLPLIFLVIFEIMYFKSKNVV